MNKEYIPMFLLYINYIIIIINLLYICCRKTRPKEYKHPFKNFNFSNCFLQKFNRFLFAVFLTSFLRESEFAEAELKLRHAIHKTAKIYLFLILYSGFRIL